MIIKFDDNTELILEKGQYYRDIYNDICRIDDMYFDNDKNDLLIQYTLVNCNQELLHEIYAEDVNSFFSKVCSECHHDIKVQQKRMHRLCFLIDNNDPTKYILYEDI